jgi:hypothetical protein
MNGYRYYVFMLDLLMLWQAAFTNFAARVSYNRPLHRPELISNPELLFVLRFSLFTLEILTGSSFEVAQLNRFTLES